MQCSRWQYSSNELYNSTLYSVLGGNTGAMSYTTIHYAVSWVAMSYSLRRGRENAAVNKRSSDIWTLKNITAILGDGYFEE